MLVVSEGKAIKPIKPCIIRVLALSSQHYLIISWQAPVGILGQGPGLTERVHENKSMNPTPLWIYLVSQFLNFQSFAKPVGNKTIGEPEDTEMEDLPVRSDENVPDMVEVMCGDKSYLLPVDKLAAKSQFFARAFEVPMAEKMGRKVVLKDFDENVFEKVVKYIVEDSFLFDMQTEAGVSP